MNDLEALNIKLEALENAFNEFKQNVENQINLINEKMQSLDLININQNNNSLLFSDVEYETLSEAEKNNNKIYFIKD